MNYFQRFQQQRSLISLRRACVDSNAVQGFVLAASRHLVLLQYVYDFNLDGLMVLRTEDISEIERTKTDEFQQSLLQAEGSLTGIQFDLKVDLTSWSSAISHLRREYPLVILECELTDEPDFALGRVLDVGDDEVTILTFSGAANWSDEPISLQCEEITSCQVDTNYINFYQRYFERSEP